jgi:hypothetical protein
MTNYRLRLQNGFASSNKLRVWWNIFDHFTTLFYNKVFYGRPSVEAWLRIAVIAPAG